MSFTDIWQQAGEDDWEPPAGIYSIRIVNGDTFTSQDGRHFCKVRLRVTKGTHEGKEFEHFMAFSNAIGARISRTALVMYGVDGEAVRDFDELGDAVERLIGTQGEVNVKHKDGYVNIDVIRVLTGESDLGNDQAAMFETTPASKTKNAIQDDDDIPY